MKTQSMQFKFLMTIISAMLAITIFIGGLSVYELDKFVQLQTKDFVNVTCEKHASQINDVLGDMQKAVHIMESYVYGLIESESDIRNTDKQNEIMDMSDDMFVDVAKNTDKAVAYYLRFAPEVANSTSGFFYSKQKGEGDFVRFKNTDLNLYRRGDDEHVGWYWKPYEARKPVWLLPYYNKNNGILMISYVVPLIYNDEFFGVVGMDFDYTVLTDTIHKIKIYENGFAHLEYDGIVIHDGSQNENAKVSENSKEYLRVSRELINGMTIVLSADYNDIEKIRLNISLKIVCVVVILAVLFSLIAVYTVKRIAYPLKELTEAVVKLSEGNYDVDIVHCDTEEIKLLSTAFENMAFNIKEHERLQNLLAYRDKLTGLRNTNSYRVWLADFDKELEKVKTDFAVLMFDLNNLKETNDNYGHDVGDKLIATAAQVISDIFKRSPVFRIGGDEFLVVLQNRDLEDYWELIGKFNEECKNELVTAGDKTISLSISKGFARFDAEKDTKFIDVFNRADDAMYWNKRETKGKV